MRFLYLLFSLLASTLLAACAYLPELNQRPPDAKEIAQDAGWLPLSFNTGGFVLGAYAQPSKGEIQVLTLYIEGDGDPNPQPEMTALRLALRQTVQPGQRAAYLARPCQMVVDRYCENNPKYWTTHRYSPEIVLATNRAIDQLKQRVRALHLELVGYDGGGTLAMLVAARRDDVARVITIASPLDLTRWSRLNPGVLPLGGSLDPMDFTANLRNVRQVHFIGGSDNQVPMSIALAFEARLKNRPLVDVQVIDGFDHRCCWVDQWPQLYSRLPVIR